MGRDAPITAAVLPTAPPERALPRIKARYGPAGLHLFDRTTGLNLLVDERVAPPSEWAVAPRFVSIALTNACDLHCPHCYAPKHGASARASVLKTWLSELDLLGCLGVGFGGGEPTLWKDLPALCAYLASDTSLAITLTTHAHHFDSELGDKLRGRVHFLRVSMDGVGSTYEKLRGRPFAALQRRLAVVRHTAPFGINFVVNRLTLPDLPRAAELAADEGASELLLLPEQPVDGRGGIDADTMNGLNDWVASRSSRVRLSTSQSNICDLPTCDPLGSEGGLRAYAHIDASGALKRSSYDNVGVPIGTGTIASAIERLQALT